MSLPEPRLLVFDLDGTLIDSRVDLTNSVNAMLEHFGKVQLPESQVAEYIGDGVVALVRRSLAHGHLVADEADPHDERFIEEAVRWFIGFYKVHKLDFTYVYPGVLEALGQIRQARPALPMAVLTNKPVNPSRAICRALGLEPFLFANYGGNSFATKKPDPEGLVRLMREGSALLAGEAPIVAGETVMIGDSHVDVETARACGARSLGCAYGLSPESLAAARPDRSVAHAAEWPEALGFR